jgi:hypothetical protein
MMAQNQNTRAEVDPGHHPIPHPLAALDTESNPNPADLNLAKIDTDDLQMSRYHWGPPPPQNALMGAHLHLKKSLNPIRQLPLVT